MNLGLKNFVKLSWTLCYWIFTSQNFNHTTSEGAKRTTLVITKKGKIWHKKRSNHHKPAWDVRAKEMCIKKAKRRYTVLKS